MCARDHIDRYAGRACVVGQRKQFAHRVNWKSKAATSTDEGKSLPVGISILSATRCTAPRLSQQALRLVKTDCRDLRPGRLAKLTNTKF